MEEDLPKRSHDKEVGGRPRAPDQHGRSPRWGPCAPADDAAPGEECDPSLTGNARSGTTSSPSAKTYAKRKATSASFAGHMYEVKMLALLYLRLTNSQDTIHEFYMATNVEGLIPLDDVVITYATTAEPTSVNTVFIQLKHRIKKKIDAYMFKSAYGDFYLQRYYKAFKNIKRMFMSEEGERPVLFRGSFTNCQFLIYTPAPEGKMFGKSPRKNSASDIDVLLTTGSSETDVERKEKIFKFNKQIDEKIFAQLGAHKGGETFLRMLRVFAGQALEGELDAMIRTELVMRLADKTSSEVDMIYRSYLDSFRRWWSDSDVLLDKHSDILNKCVDECKLSRLSLLQDDNAFGLKFKGVHLFDVNVLDRDTLVHVVASSRSVQLSCTKLVQSLRDVKGGYTVIGLDALVKETEVMLSAWNSGSKERFVIVSESTEKHEDVCDVVVRRLRDIMENKKKKLILVSVGDDPFVSTLKQTLLDGKFKDVHDEFRLAQLETECKEAILNGRIVFQGAATTWGEILGEEGEATDAVVDDDLVRRALRGTTTLGPSLAEDVAYYVTRTLERRDVVDAEVLRRATSDDVFVVRGVATRELEALIPPGERVAALGESDECRFLAVESSTTDDDEVRRRVARVLERKENVHELRMSPDGRLRWIATKGTTDVFAYDERTTTPYDPGTALDLEARTVLLIAEPGMGKTTFVTHLASATKTQHPSFWVVRVDLREHKGLLDVATRCDDAAGFLSSAVGVVDRSEVALFRHVVENTGRCAVFLDGFDEIAPRYTAGGLALMRSILATNVRKIFITSRHAARETLESGLSTRAFTLRRFDEADQKLFLERFWSRRDGFESIVTIRRRRLTDHVVRLIARLLDDAGREFMGIPLHAMMLAEIYEDHYARDAGTSELPEELNLLTMFETFIDKKFVIYLRQRFPDVEDIESESKKLSKSVYKEHMYASLELLLGKVKINGLHKGKKIVAKNVTFYEEVSSSDNKTGIIVEVSNGRPVFVHRTFAEYFAARWFSENFAENGEFLRDNLFTDEFGVVRSQFDLMLARESELLTAVVENNVRRVRVVLASSASRGDVVARDHGGRSALHLAAALGDAGYRYEDPDDRPIGPAPQTMVELLLEHGADASLGARDDVTSWSPPEYAAAASSWDALERLLRRAEDDDDVAFSLRGLVSNKRVVEHGRWGRVVESTLIHAASAHGLAHLVGVLGGASPDVVWMRDGEDRTPLHVACRRGEMRAVRLLIGLVEDDEIDARRGGGVVSHDIDAAVDAPESPDVVTIISDDDEESEPGSDGDDDATGGEPPDADVTIISDDEDDRHTRDTWREVYVTRPKSLLEYANTPDRDLSTALHLASGRGHAEVSRLLVSKKANVWMVDKNERTPLHAACEYGSESAARVLLDSLGGGEVAESAARVLLDSPGGREVAESAARVLLDSPGGGEVSEPTARVLLDSLGGGEVAEPTARVLLESPGSGEVAEYIDKASRQGRTALHEASERGFLDVVRLLVSKGGDVTRGDFSDSSPLHYACARGHTAVARALIGGLGSDVDAAARYVNAVNTREQWQGLPVDGESALQLASRGGHAALVRLLVAAGGDVWADGGDGGGTLLHDACRWSDVGTARVLVESLEDDFEVRVYLDAVDDDGRDARDLCEEFDKGRTEVLQYLDCLNERCSEFLSN